MGKRLRKLLPAKAYEFCSNFSCYFKLRLKNILPAEIYKFFSFSHQFKLIRRRVFGRATSQLETTKARPRRVKEGFFEKYCKGSGIDIGYGGDLVVPNCQGWDIEHGDAQYLKGLESDNFDFVYSSHTLEHLINLEVALKSWWNVLRRNGYLIIYIPHRHLYEEKKTLPSAKNPDHKHFFLVEEDDPPDTVGVVPLIKRVLTNHEIVYAKECSENGEYSIEIVVRKHC